MHHSVLCNNDHSYISAKCTTCCVRYPEAVPRESKERMEETLRRSETAADSKAAVMDFVKIAAKRTAEIDRIVADRRMREAAERSGSHGSTSSRSSTTGGTGGSSGGGQGGSW
jgi:uncharacterized membrane protein YgcG